MRRVATVLLFTLAACTESGGTTEQVAANGGAQTHESVVVAPGTLSEAERAECLAAGGTIGRGGLFPDEVCFRPMPDAGKACRREGDCQGFCLVDEAGRGQCAKISPIFGCFEYLDAQGRKQAICMD